MIIIRVLFKSVNVSTKSIWQKKKSCQILILKKKKKAMWGKMSIKMTNHKKNVHEDDSSMAENKMMISEDTEVYLPENNYNVN